MSSNPLPVRSPLDLLRLDFPGYQITMRAICGKLFYLAEADRPHIQPRFAQAGTTERLRARLHAPIRPFIPATEPSIPRVWDYLLGGKDNFAADRQQAASLLKVFPRAAELARESRQFQRRAVAYVARAGIRQFIDLGCGLPTTPSTHQTARDVHATVAYVDNDEQVLTHAQNILATTGGVLSVAGDLQYPDEILYDGRLRQAVDFHQPMCLVITMTLHFYDAGTARRIAAQFIADIPPGSYVVLSVGQLEGEAGEDFTTEYRPGRLHHHSEDDVTSFLHGLELAGPGITEARRWRAPVVSLEGGRPGHIWVGVGRKAETAP